MSDDMDKSLSGCLHIDYYHLPSVLLRFTDHLITLHRLQILCRWHT